MLLTRFLERPTVSAIKGDILKLNVQIIENFHPVFKAGFDEKKLENDEAVKAEKIRIDNLIIRPHSKVERMMLKLLAYDVDSQNELLPRYWEIEHIFPQTWDTKFYTFDKEEANEKLEHIGNKLPLEKKLNISASNNYFPKKKEKYGKSNIIISKELGKSSIDDWNLENIIHNDAKICERVKEIFTTWVNDYKPLETVFDVAPMPTPEEQKMIDMLRSKGLIK